MGMITNEMSGDVIENEPTETFLSQTDSVICENPVPVIFTAIALGFALGLLASRFRSNPAEAFLKDTSSNLDAFIRPLRSHAKDAYQTSSGAVKDVMGKLHEVQSPRRRWWKRLTA